MSAIEELQTAVAQAAENVGPSIVGIGRGTRGSGIVLAAGKVLTNAHNLRSDTVNVTFADGRALVLDARAAGLAAALVAVALRAPVLVVILAAAATAGGLRAIS